MYPVSDAYKAAAKRQVQRYRLRGTMRMGFRTAHITEDNFVKGSFNLEHQCSGSDNVEIGTVYTAELTATLCGLDLTRYTVRDAVLELSVELHIDGDVWEAVPLGIFNVNEANWAAEGIEIVAHDNMSRFDREIALSSSTGTVYDYLTLCCKACGVELGITQEDAQALPNGSLQLALYQENDIEAWRDLISWCAQTTATFASIDREGRLILRGYGVDPVDTIDDRHRFTGARFSDYVTRYTGVSMVNIAEQDTRYYSLVPDDGLTYNLGRNPLLQYGLDETLETQRRAILQALSAICYVPMEVSMLSAPVYDLGDVLVFEAGLADAGQLSCITKYDWSYDGGYTATGVGQNPALAGARSKTDKELSGLQSQISKDSMHYYDYINAEAYRIGDGRSARIIDIRYVTTRQTHVDFHAEIKYRLDTTETGADEVFRENDGVLRVSYNLNGEDILDYYPVETRADGTHLLHLMYVWNATGNVIGTFTVTLEVNGGTVEIDVGDCRAYMAGQGLVGDGAWDGGVQAEDMFEAIVASDVIGIGAFTDEAIATLPEHHGSGLSDTVRGIDVHSLILGGIRDAFDGLARTRWFDPVHTAEEMTSEGVALEGGHWQLALGQDNGWIQTPPVPMETVYRVTSSHSNDDVGYLVSFDAGGTWWAYADMWREVTYAPGVNGMLETTMRAIPESAWAEKLPADVVVRAILTRQAELFDICIYEEELQT